jgi:carbamoyltransferase
MSRPHLEDTLVTRNYIGLATSAHDTALAVVDSAGKVVFAEATERYLQFKRAIGVAPDVVHHTADVLERVCDPDTEFVVAHSWADRPSFTATEVMRWMGTTQLQLEQRYGPDVPDFQRSRLVSLRQLYLAANQVAAVSGYTIDAELLNRLGWRHGAVDRRRYDHHLTHAAAACFSSPFDEAVCAVVDGLGEQASCGFFVYRDGKLQQLAQTGSAWASLGFFYSAACHACGFHWICGDEWKVMGLAAYGHPDQALIEFFGSLIRANGLSLEGNFSDAAVERIWNMRRRKGAPAIDFANVAYAAQKVFTDTLLQLLNSLYEKGFSRNLVLGGGCALNSSTSGRILDQTPFENLYVFCAPADDGNAVGAALLAHREDHPDHRPAPRWQSPYLGSSMSRDTLANVKAFNGSAKITECRGDAPRRAAQALAQGQIIGWIQGRAEFGPRALGNRSILADPRSPDIKERINSRVKFREEFRPFAPSILHELGPEYFEHYQESPYMERTLKFRPEVIHRVPGVVHVDGTGRLQTVKPEWNERYHQLIRCFYELTGIPLVLNTSFNVMGKPIAHSVEDVLAVFYSSGLQTVFIDDLMIEK